LLLLWLVWLLVLGLEVVRLLLIVVVLLLLRLGVLLRWRAEDGGLRLRAGVAWDGREDGRLGAPVRGVPFGRVEGARDALRGADDQGHVLDRGTHHVVRPPRLGFMDRGARVELCRGRLPAGAREGVMLLLGDGALVRGAPPAVLTAWVTVGCYPRERETAR
jgi:hypothetical protein